MNHRDVLDFWFGSISSTEQYRRGRNKLWFGGGQQVDDEIRTRFGSLIDAAGEGALGHWKNEPESLLALVILLDQFSLNVYRDQVRSYELCDLALPLSLEAIEKGFDRALHPLQRTFLYLPLEHAEDLRLQQRAVTLFTQMRDEAPDEFWRSWHQDSLDFAVRHLRVIERFGRFPHRNEALGRSSNAEEKAFLAQGQPF